MAFVFPKPSAESPPMFESAFIDAFSRTPWYLVPLLHFPMMGYLYWLGMQEGSVGILPSLGFVAAGWLVWTLTEYWAHRTLFHWEPPGKFGERMHFILHGVHHQWPRDQYRLVFPPALSLSLGALFLFIFVAAIGTAGYFAYVGFAFGYVVYDLMHYHLHHGRARFEWIKKLRKHHLVHHSPKYADNAKFGVSTTLWDHVFRTWNIERKAPKATAES